MSSFSWPEVEIVAHTAPCQETYRENCWVWTFEGSAQTLAHFKLSYLSCC